jgi:hypothetical protein
MTPELWNEIITFACDAGIARINEWSGDISGDVRKMSNQFHRWAAQVGYPLPQAVLDRLALYIEFGHE